MRGILIPTFSIGYIHIPKVACTSIKHVLYELEFGKNFLEDVKEKKYNIHRYYESRLRSIEEAKFRFIVVRDPIKRFLSAYSNRVLYHKELYPYKIQENMERKRRNNKTVFVNRLERYLEKNLPGHPRIGKFINNLEDYRMVWDIRRHTDPVSKIIGKKDLSYFSHVYRIEKMGELEKDLENLTGREIRFSRLQTGGRKISVGELNERQLEKLFRFYDEDYRLLADFYPKEALISEWEVQRKKWLEEKGEK